MPEKIPGMAQQGYGGKIPESAIAALEREAGCKIPVPQFTTLAAELKGILHGSAWLTIRNGKVSATIRFRVRDGKLSLYEINRQSLPEVAGDGKPVFEHGRCISYLPEDLQ